MARGDLFVFEEAKLALLDGTHDLDTNTFKIALITTLPTAADLTPALADYTEVTGTNYTAGGETLTISLAEASGTVTFNSTAQITWTQHASGPTNIKAGLIYDTTAAGNKAIIAVDFTADSGTTAISLADGDITFDAHASGLFTLA